MALATIKSVISQLRIQWGTPKPAIHRGETVPFDLVCRFSEGVTDIELLGLKDMVPNDLLDFWKEANEADLFVDPKYGQWGLRIWSPSKAMKKTQQLRSLPSMQLTSSDFVIGEFLGDADLMVVRCEPTAADFGNILISLGIDSREDWPVIAGTFTEFLSIYTHESGDKFWERASAASH